MSKLLPILVQGTGLREHDLRMIIRNAPIRYKTYRIPKRNGGARTISQPAREVKALQRILISHILDQLPIHPSATAYRSGLSIRENAERHAKNGPLLKFDFQNFFPSILARDWQKYCLANSVFDNEEDLLISTKILFHHEDGKSALRLAIGAPSSPMLSNILMMPFDARVCDLARINSVTYTRYADDLTFSAKRTGFLNGVERMLRRVITEIKSPSLVINESKTVLATPKYRRVVTGLVLANDGRVSLGHERKKLIRAGVHHALLGKLTPDKLNHLAGLLAFAQDIEPEFFARIIEKYGMELIREIRAVRARKPTE